MRHLLSHTDWSAAIPGGLLLARLCQPYKTCFCDAEQAARQLKAQAETAEAAEADQREAALQQALVACISLPCAYITQSDCGEAGFEGVQLCRLRRQRLQRPTRRFARRAKCSARLLCSVLWRPASRAQSRWALTDATRATGGCRVSLSAQTSTCASLCHCQRIALRLAVVACVSRTEPLGFDRRYSPYWWLPSECFAYMESLGFGHRDLYCQRVSPPRAMLEFGMRQLVYAGEQAAVIEEDCEGESVGVLATSRP